MRRAARSAHWRILAPSALLLALAACTEGTAPVSLGMLRVRPVFQPGEEPEALGIAPRDIRMVLSKDNGVIVADTTLPYTRGDTTSWLLELTTPPESVSISARLGQGAAAMYEGTDVVSLGAGLGPGSTHHDLLVAYLGTTAFAVRVAPDSTHLATPGLTTQFAAEAVDGQGQPLDGFSFTWSSTSPHVATVHPTTGLVTAVGPGRTLVSAASGGVSDTAVVTVGSLSNVASIVVSPNPGSITALGASLQFSAIARDAQGNVMPGVVYQWSSTNSTVASVSSNGLATGLSVGGTTITAAAIGVSGSATLAVTQVPAAIVIVPNPAIISALGATQQFHAIAVDALGRVVHGAAFSWTSSNPGVATITPVGGLATAVSSGTTMITATAGNLQQTARLTVSQTIHSIAVFPGADTLAAGDIRQFVAVARDANGHTIPNAPLTWSTSSPSVATVSSSGLATAHGEGNALITASAGNVSGAGALNVVVVGSIDLGPFLETHVALHGTKQFVAIVRDPAGNVLTGVRVTWSSDDPLIASIDPLTGIARGNQPGFTRISASAGNVTSQVWLIVQQLHD